MGKTEAERAIGTRTPAKVVKAGPEEWTRAFASQGQPCPSGADQGRRRSRLHPDFCTDGAFSGRNGQKVTPRRPRCGLGGTRRRLLGQEQEQKKNVDGFGICSICIMDGGKKVRKSKKKITPRFWAPHK